MEELFGNISLARVLTEGFKKVTGMNLSEALSARTILLVGSEISGVLYDCRLLELTADNKAMLTNIGGYREEIVLPDPFNHYSLQSVLEGSSVCFKHTLPGNGTEYSFLVFSAFYKK